MGFGKQGVMNGMWTAGVDMEFFCEDESTPPMQWKVTIASCGKSPNPRAFSRLQNQLENYYFLPIVISSKSGPCRFKTGR
jgi:hypothetical protein